VTLNIGFSGGQGFLLTECFLLTESLADPATSLVRSVLGE